MYLGREWSVNHNQRTKVNHAELQYAVLGKEDGEPVICIHGTNIADSLITPLQFYPPLFEKYKFISFYRAGYRGSTLEKDSLSIQESAEQVKQLLEHLGIEKAHIMAFSFGGVIGFQFLLSYPEMAHSAILIEPYLNRESPEAVAANVAAFERSMAIFQTGDHLGAAQQYMIDVAGPYFLSAVDMTNPLDVWERVREDSPTAFNVDLPAVVNWDFKMSEADEKWAAQKPTMPILAMMGFQSEAAMPGFRETQQFLMSWLPQAERAGIENATHGMQSMNPVAVGEAALGFLEKHPMKLD